tara:strand:- start:9494 stop:10114 length:621 start_codon:yes stop_codon:yes gene_type:complete
MSETKKTPAKKTTAKKTLADHKAKDTIWKALGRFQMKMPILHQGAKAHSYTYTDLKTIVETAVPIAYEEGLVWNYKLEGTGLTTRLFHMESGCFDESFVELPVVELRGMNSVQSKGAVITYFKRYSISCLLNLVDSSDIDVQGEIEKIKPKAPEPSLKLISDGDFKKLLAMYGKEWKGKIITTEFIESAYALNPNQQKRLKEVSNG